MGNTIKNLAKDKNCKPLITTFKGRTVWVRKEKQRGKIKYRLTDGSHFRGSLKTNLDDITKEFHKYIQDNKNIEYVVYEPKVDNELGLPEFTEEQIEEWDTKKTKYPKFTEKQIEELKKGKTEEDLKIIANNLENIEALAFKIYWDKHFTDVANIKKIEEETGKKVITIPNINIKKVTQKIRTSLDEDDEEEITVEKYQIHKIDKNYIIEEFMKMLADNPSEIAALTKIPQFTDLQNLYIPKQERTPIDGLLDEYKKHINQTIQDPKNVAKNITDASNFYNEFLAIVKIKTRKVLKYLEEIKLEDVKEYTSELYKVATDKRYTAKWLGEHQLKLLQLHNNYPKNIWYQHRISKFITLLNIYTTNKISSNESQTKKTIDNILFWISKSLEIKNVKKVNAQIISKEDFKTIYNSCKDDNKLYLTMALLNAFTLQDLKDLKVAEIDFKTGAILKNREKTGEIRIGYLPPPILKQVKERITNKKQEYVFENFSVKGRRDYFYDLVNRLKLPHIKFKMLRKTTATTATICPNVNELQIKLLLGHSIKIENHYINKNIDSIKQIVEFIQAEYLSDITILI